MDSLRNCAKINHGLLTELALRLTDDQRILVSELYRMMRTIYLGMKVVTGNSHLFGLDSNPLSEMIYSKNLKTIWDVSMDALNPLRLATSFKQARKLVDDAVRTQLISPVQKMGRQNRTIEQYYSCWIGKLQARKRLLTEYGWVYNSYRYENFLHTVAEERVSRIPEGGSPIKLKACTNFEKRTICHGFLSMSPVRSLSAPVRARVVSSSDNWTVSSFAQAGIPSTRSQSTKRVNFGGVKQIDNSFLCPGLKTTTLVSSPPYEPEPPSRSERSLSLHSTTSGTMSPSDCSIGGVASTWRWI